MIPNVAIPEGASGNWRIEHFEVSESESRFDMIRSRSRAVLPGKYTRLMRGRCVVMSDTPAEKSDHYSPVRHATGNVLINGLGLGMVLNAILQKPEVTDVTVIEASEDVIALVAPVYQKDPRVTIIHADAYTWQPPKGKVYDVVWHDIWDDLCTDNLQLMAKLHRKYGRRCRWQGSWGKELLEYRRRQEQREDRRWGRW